MTHYVHVPLPYDFSALEPAIDARTMEIHHDGHLGAYVRNLNALIEKYDLQNLPPRAMDFVQAFHRLAADVPDRDRLRFNLGGVANHEFFFSILGKKSAAPGAPLASAIDENFGTFVSFQNLFQKSAIDLMGSGWTWLAVDLASTIAQPFPRLFICNTSNHDNPLMRDVFASPVMPILCLDMWEHAYYLRHQNRKTDYLAAFWCVVDWDRVDTNYASVLHS
ncbi:MAG: superoxide dismutase [Puniceicoccales bacterium]|jgi:Fe-Mn family superoxide dismutase|nr:superoxide dismutase [Puniceicoccales bacterium]